MEQPNLPTIVDTFRRIGARLEHHARTDTKTEHLNTQLVELGTQCGRLLVAAIDAGVFPEARKAENGEWWNRSLGRLPGGIFAMFNDITFRQEGSQPSQEEYRKKASGDLEPNQFYMIWRYAIGSWLVKAFPTRFRQNAGTKDWAQVAKTEDGGLRGKDGKPLTYRWYKDGQPLPDGFGLSRDLPPGEYEYRLSGQIAFVQDFFDSADSFNRNHDRAEVYADACRVLVDLLKRAATDAGPWPGELTVTEAARWLIDQDVIDGLTLEGAKARISSACRSGAIRCRGKWKDRRIDPDSLAAWTLEIRKRELNRE